MRGPITPSRQDREQGPIRLTRQSIAKGQGALTSPQAFTALGGVMLLTPDTRS